MKRPSWHTEPEPDPNNPSKSQVKRDYLELQDFGLKMLGIPQVLLDRLEMDDDLREALAELRRMGNKPARRRQAQYVGKLLRDVDLEPFRRVMVGTR